MVNENEEPKKKLYMWCDACQKVTEHARDGKLLKCKRCGRRRQERAESKVPNVLRAR